MLFTLYICKEALERLDDYLDRELSPTEIKRVERHLKICHACTRKFAFEKATLEAIRAKMEQVPVPESLREKIARALASSD